MCYCLHRVNCFLLQVSDVSRAVKRSRIIFVSPEEHDPDLPSFKVVLVRRDNRDLQQHPDAVFRHPRLQFDDRKYYLAQPQFLRDSKVFVTEQVYSVNYCVVIGSCYTHGFLLDRTRRRR